MKSGLIRHVMGGIAPHANLSPRYSTMFIDRFKSRVRRAVSDETGAIGRSVKQLIADPRVISGGDGTEDLYDEETAALVGRLTSEEEPLSDEELSELRATLVAEIKAKAAEDNDDALEEMARIKADITDIDTEAAARDEAAEAREAKRTELLADLDPEEEETPAEEPAAEAAEEDPEEEETPATPEAEADPETPAADPEEAPAEAIAAAADPSPGAVRRRSRAASRTEPEATSPVTIVASGDVPGFSAGNPIKTLLSLGEAFGNKLDAVIRGGKGRYPVASIKVQYPQDRQLDSTLDSNERKLNAVTSPQAIVAAGGYCGPVDVDYTFDRVGSTIRPLRDSLARFGATRGGIRVTPPMQLADVAGAVGVWTDANDVAAATDPDVRKSCLRVVCEDEVEIKVSAMVKCLDIGNFVNKFYPERFPAFNDLATVAHARLAEEELWDDLVANSTAVTSQKVLGASRDVLTTLERARAAIVYRHRLDDNAMFRAEIPAWYKPMMRTDIARQLPGDQTMAVTDAQIEEWFRVRYINVTWVLDDPADPFGTQAAGALNRWPEDLELLLFPEGTHVFLDGGTLDLGIELRSPDYNKKNDVQAFMESWEATYKRGAADSYAITIEGICAPGESSGTTDITPAVCTAGS